jgi:formiminoglutamase
VSNFSSSSPHLFFTKNDPLDKRLGEIFKPRTPEQLLINNSFAIIGYPDDDGIKMNGGRIGAAEGPKKIREFLYKMTPPILIENENQFSDIGDLQTSIEFSKRHMAAKHMARSLYEKQIRVISLGGGHDYGYADAAAFVEEYQNSFSKPVVLNFDAHLDVRPTTNGFNSGTPFFRLLNDYPNAFDFVEIGIQPQCNSIHHKIWARDKGAHLFELTDIQKRGGLLSLFENNFFKGLNSDTPVFISFDIDGLTSTEAGGCSQSWVTGLQTQDFLNFFHELKTKANLRGLGIYEVSPQLDVDNRTSKTAALLAFNFLFQDQL